MCTGRPAPWILAAATILWLAGSAAAVPITIYEDLDASGDYTAGEERTGASHGDGGGSYGWSFDLDAATHDPVTTVIQIVFTTYDHNWEISINGSVVVPLDPGDPAVFSPAVQTPWTANSNALPRLVMDLSSGSIDFAGSLTTGATSMTGGLLYNQPLVLPVFQDGQNSIVIVNPDSTGPDGMEFAISGSVGLVPVPEPRSAFLLLAGLAWMARQRRTRRDAVLSR